MRDLDLAKRVLKEENLALVVVKNGEVIYKSTDRGIKPMYYITTEMKEQVLESSIADKVIGKGAALLYVNLNIREVYGDIISKAGMKTLDKAEIPYEFLDSCEYIKNREGTGYCPIEKLSMDVEDPNELIGKIKIFLASIAQKTEER